MVRAYKSLFRHLSRVAWWVAGVLKKRASAKIFFERMPEREGWAP
jgi:hypothetical protein